MYMDGFKWTTGGSSQPCTALLFKSWSLHTPGLLALGFFFTIAMGASIEAMASIRRKLQNTGFCNCHNIPPTKSRAYSVGIYAVQVTVGYLLMLISMTYNFVLFSSVVVGLVIGHLCFGASAPVPAPPSPTPPPPPARVARTSRPATNKTVPAARPPPPPPAPRTSLRAAPPATTPHRERLPPRAIPSTARSVET